MSDGICIWTQHYDHARFLNNYTVPLTQQTCHLPLSVRDTHRGQCWEQQVELARTAETYLPVVEVNAVFVKRTRASRDVEFTTLTSAMEELGWMFAHPLKIRKGVNGAAPWWFCSAREPLCSWAAHVYCPVTRVPGPSHGRKAPWTVCSPLLLSPGYCSTPMFDFLKVLLWERFRVVFIFFLSFNENWKGRLELHSEWLLD